MTKAMTKAKWKKLVAEVDRFLLADPDKLPKKKREQWYAGTRRLLIDLRKRREEDRNV